MVSAAIWGGIVASSLIVGMLAAFIWTPSTRMLGMILGFGAGALFSAIAFDLVVDALEYGSEILLTLGMLIGAATYVTGSRILRAKTGREDDDDSRSIVLGATLDGIPESLAIGATVAAAGGSSGAVSLTLPVAVALSNLPEAIGATLGMLKSGKRAKHITAIWVILVVASAFSAAIGYVILAEADRVWSAIISSFTAGAVLTMVADTMTPDAYRDAGRIAGVTTVLGFSVSLLLT